MNTDSRKYYERYEDRYQRVYAQGINHWTGNPDEIATVITHLNDFIQFAGMTPSEPIIEFGCGEGFVGEHLLRKGYAYLGIDLSSSALKKARHRVGGKYSSFRIADITNLKEVEAGSFIAALDNFCLHMLVTDEDRRRYLAEVYRVLTPGGYAWFHEGGQSEKFKEPIHSLEEFLVKHPVDLVTCEAREAFMHGIKKTIFLPRLPARFNSVDGYREEMERANFNVHLIEKKESGIIIYVRKEK